MTDQKKFHEWLRQNGAEVLAPTNPYEYARFIAHGCVNVVYTGRRGFSASGFANDCLDAYLSGQKNIDMGIVKKPRTPMGKLKIALLNRDGVACFYCGVEMVEDGMTVEHLVSRQNGGPDHMDNLVLAHESCNKKVANLPLRRKIQLREDMRRGKQ